MFFRKGHKIQNCRFFGGVGGRNNGQRTKLAFRFIKIKRKDFLIFFGKSKKSQNEEHQPRHLYELKMGIKKDFRVLH